MTPRASLALRWLAPAAAVTVALFALALDNTVTSAYEQRAIDDIGQGVAALIAGAAWTWRSMSGGGRSRTGGMLTAAGMFAWAAGETVWSYYELIARRETPFPSFADLGYLLFPVLVLAGLLVRPSSAFKGTGRWRVVLDGIMVAGSLLTLSWLTSLGSVVHAGADSTFALATAIAYPAGDIVVLTVAVLVLCRDGFGGPLPTLCVGLVALCLADSGFAYLTATSGYSTGAWVDISWFAGFLVCALAALIRRPAKDGRTTGLDTAVTMALPYVLVLIAVGAQIVLAVRGRLDPVALITTLIVVSVVMVRQLLVVVDNRNLTRDVLAQRAELSFRAFHDSLTGLANRALFRDRVEHALELHRRDMRPITVVFVDLDDFKAVNDTHGHDVGDAVLVAVAQRLCASVRAGDTIARLGGDEFAILVEDEGLAETLTTRLLESMDVPILVGESRVSVTASIGTTALAPEQGGSDIDTLLKQADLAMYSAKRSGKARTVSYLAPAPCAPASIEQELLAAAEPAS